MIHKYATFGPSCDSTEVLVQMLQEGITGMRLNLSHTSLEESADRIRNYMEACRTVNRRPELLIDLHGPEQRIGRLKGHLPVRTGAKVVAASRNTGEECPCIPVSPLILVNLVPGDHLLIRDGLIQLEVEKALPASVPALQDGEALPETDDGRFLRFQCTVLRGGTVRSLQSVKIEGKEVYGNLVTSADRENLQKAALFGVTSVMQPFVRSGEDIHALRKILRDLGLHARIFAKIESQTGLANLDSIIDAADVVVIARGDLGNTMPLWELPAVQKEISTRCRQKNRPFMVVTQMLHSMEENAVPTRAEVSDIFHAVLDGAAYVMITGESAVGRFPAEASRYLCRTADEAESYLLHHDLPPVLA